MSTVVVSGLIAASLACRGQQSASAQHAGATSSGNEADIVLTGGKVITVDDLFSIAQAVANPRRVGS
jgi:hypothetical protein